MVTIGIAIDCVDDQILFAHGHREACYLFIMDF